MTQPGISHNETQRTHVARLLSYHARIRERPMFGCPAFFLERRMVACVYGDEVGIKLPSSRADVLVANDVVAPFRPYGKAM